MSGVDHELLQQLRARVNVLEGQVDTLRQELGAMARRAEKAAETMSVALDAANKLIAYQENEIAALEAVEGLLRM